MAAVQRGAKINFYKFVDPKSGVSAKSSPLVKTMQAQTQAINSLGGVVNSINQSVASLKDAQMKLLKIDQEKARKAFKPIYSKPKKPIKSKAFDSLFKGKIPSFWESLLGLASAFLKYFLVLPALKWLADEKNQDKVVTCLLYTSDAADE